MTELELAATAAREAGPAGAALLVALRNSLELRRVSRRLPDDSEG